MIPGTRRRRRVALLSAVVLSLTFAIPVSAHGGDHRPKPKPKPDPIVNVQVLAFNDYHGHLEATTPGTVGTTPAGGSEYLATHLKTLRTGHKNTVTVAAGDLIGGTPFLSGIFHDEPSVESLNALGLDVSSVGNHEFDQGVKELRRMQYGGCHPVDGCYFPDDPYAGADFPWLAANVVKEGTRRTVLPPYWIKKFQGVKVGFIGMTLEDTPSLVAQSGIEGWDFKDEVETANALVPKLRREGVQAIVVLLHEGGMQTGTFDECVGISGPIVEIQAGLHPEIDLLVTGHTHQPYNCTLTDPAGQPRHVTSAFSFGRIISEIDLPINKRTGEVVRADVTVVNHLVDQTVAKDPQQTAIIAKWKSISDAVGNKPVGNITATIARGKTASGSEDRAIESDLGNMIADAQLWASLGSGAQLALMNPGGVRGDLLFPQATGEGDGVVTYAEAFTVQPFGNLMSTMPMIGSSDQGGAGPAVPAVHLVQAVPAPRRVRRRDLRPARRRSDVRRRRQGDVHRDHHLQPEAQRHRRRRRHHLHGRGQQLPRRRRGQLRGLQGHPGRRSHRRRHRPRSAQCVPGHPGSDRPSRHEPGQRAAVANGTQLATRRGPAREGRPSRFAPMP